MEPQQPCIDRGVIGQSMVLKLQIIASPAKEGIHLQSVGLGPLIVPVSQPAGHLPRQTGRKADKALRPLTEQVQIDPGLDVKALGIGLAYHVREVAVTHLVFAQQNQVPGLTVQLVDTVKPGPGRHIDLAADDRLDALRLAGAVKINDPIHSAVVGDSHGGLSQLLHPLHQLGDTAGPVQKGIFRMVV